MGHLADLWPDWLAPGGHRVLHVAPIRGPGARHAHGGQGARPCRGAAVQRQPSRTMGCLGPVCFGSAAVLRRQPPGLILEMWRQFPRMDMQMASFTPGLLATILDPCSDYQVDTTMIFSAAP